MTDNPSINPGAPLSAADLEVFLGGILIDPVTITYEVLDPSTVTAVDEDGLAVSGRTPFQEGEGRYSARNTVLPLTAPAGQYTIEWTIKKTVPLAPIMTVRTFVLLSEPAVDAARDGQSRRDVPDTKDLVNYRALVLDNGSDDTKWAFFNSELVAFLDRAVTVHTKGLRTYLVDATPDDVAMALYIAQCSFFRAVAKSRTRFFRWQDSSEQVDKSMQPDQLNRICRGLMAEYEGIQRRRLDEREEGLSAPGARDLAQFTPKRARSVGRRL